MRQFGCYSQHSDTLVCPKCGKKGAISWEDAPLDSDEDKGFLAIEGDFYERLAKKNPHPIELVCNGCGTVQPG